MSIPYIKRGIEKTVKNAAQQFPSVILTGPRQSGKTTLLKHLFSKSHRYVSMDNPELRLMAIDEPALFFENYPPPLIIDEIQYTPQIFSYIKIFIDNDRSKKGHFLLTGSQSFPLMANVSESLAGRIAVLSLLSFSFKEQFPQKSTFDMLLLQKKILQGGFPEIVTLEDINNELWFASYFQTYLERDVRQLRRIGDLGDFQRFVQLLATFNGQNVNLSSLSRDIGLTVNTIKAWISILEASQQIVSIKPFYLNQGKRIIKSPKIYFLDTGLLCYLTGITSPTQVFKGPSSGQLFETAVLGEIIRDFYNQGKIPRIYWWRTSHGEEVDFIIEDKARIIPIEVKLTSKVNKIMAKNLISFYNLFPNKIDKALVVNLSQEGFVLDKGIFSIPFYEFIYQI
ncbi:MAG: ATP-binding protein [bacterium]